MTRQIFGFGASSGLNNHRFQPKALAVAISLALAADIQAATISVSGGCTLVDAIVSANENTVTGSCLAGDTSGTDTLVLENSAVIALDELFVDAMYAADPSGLPSVTSDVLIQGNDATITRSVSAMDDFRIFRVVDTGHLRAENLTLSNGAVANYNLGAGILSRGSVTLDNVTITGNTVVGSGGGIFIQSTSNIDAVSLTITNSEISANRASLGGGGITATNAILDINDTTIENNFGNNGGGAIAFAESGGFSGAMAVIQNSTIRGNSTAQSAGAIQVFSGSLNLINTEISNNVGTNAGGSRGGGLYIRQDATVTMTSVNITGNTAANGAGFMAIDTSDVTVMDSQITMNEASFDGGGVNTDGSAARFYNTDILNNTATRSGGGIRNSGNFLLLEESNVSSNTSTSGGGIDSLGSSVTLLNTQVDANSANFSAGILIRSGLEINLEGATVINNSAVSFSGGINNAALSLSIVNSTIAGNIGSVGGVYSSSDLYIRDSQVSNNMPTGVVQNSNSNFSVSAVLLNSSVSGNGAANQRGGGIYARNSSLSLIGSTVSDNSSTISSGGAGILSRGSTLAIANSTISGNSSISSNIFGGYGGGMYAISSAVEVVNTTIANNYTRNGGTLRLVDSTINFSNSLVAGSNNSDCSYAQVSSSINSWFEDDSCDGTASGDPKLGPLQDNGGATFTHALLAGSGAINSGDNDTCANAPINAMDQRGVARPIGNACDIGSFESDQIASEGHFFVIPTSNGKLVIFEL